MTDKTRRPLHPNRAAYSVPVVILFKDQTFASTVGYVVINDNPSQQAAIFAVTTIVEGIMNGSIDTGSDWDSIQAVIPVNAYLSNPTLGAEEMQYLGYRAPLSDGSVLAPSFTVSDGHPDLLDSPTNIVDL